jgi:hypothetical protein
VTQLEEQRAAGWPETHQVTNQVPPLAGHDVYATDAALREAVERDYGPRTGLTARVFEVEPSRGAEVIHG